MQKLAPYLWHKPFVWITDCSGIIKFYEMDLMPNHQVQRWKLDMMRFDWTAVHRPERMLYECNLLSRYNTWASALRKRDKVQKEDRSASNAEAVSGCFWRAEVEKYKSTGSMPTGFSYVDPHIGGNGVEYRTHLAMVLDKTRSMVTVSASGHTTIRGALGPNATLQGEIATELYWNELENRHNFISFERHWERLLNRHQKRYGSTHGPYIPTLCYEWLWVECAGIADDQTLNLQRFIVDSVEDRQTRVVIMLWNDGSLETQKHRDQWGQRIECAIPLFAVHNFEVDNTNCGGHIERRTIGLFASLPFHGCDKLNFNDSEGASPMEDVMDEGNFVFSDYLNIKAVPVGVPQNGITNPLAHKVDSLIEWGEDGQSDLIPVMCPLFPAPDFSSGEYARGDIEFCVSTCDMGLSASVRPIRRHELLNLVGLKKEKSKELATGEWDRVRTVARQVTPKATVERIVSSLLTVQQEGFHKAWELGMEEDRRKRSPNPSGNGFFYRTTEMAPIQNGFFYHEIPFERYMNNDEYLKMMCGQEPASYYSNGLSSPFVASPKTMQVLTTIPMPSAEDWKQALMKDPDTAHMIQRMTARLPPLLQQLKSKAYYNQWSVGHLEVEDGVLYQWEHPKRMQIRQLCRRVVLEGMRQQVYIAYHSSGLAGHAGVHRTYWRVVARFWWPGVYEDIRKAVKKKNSILKLPTKE
jgi:hypothetical protein